MNDARRAVERWGRGSAILGGCAWLALMPLEPAGWGTTGLVERLLLLALLVFTPLGLALTVSGSQGPTPHTYRATAYSQPFAAAIAVRKGGCKPREL
jgi:hypothetical protein